MKWRDRERAGLDDEIRDHIDRETEEHVARGIPLEAARRLARLRFGNPALVQEDTRAVWVWLWLERLIQDVAYACRLLRRSPVVTAAAMLSLGLGIGANTAIFSLVDALLLKPLPLQQPDRLFFVDNTGGKSMGANGPPYPCYEILRDHTRQFAGLAMFAGADMRVGIDGVEERLRGQYVSGNYFDVLGIPASYGRMLKPADDRPPGTAPGDPVAVISHGFWTRRFGADPSVLGRRLVVDGTPMTIVGVTPRAFSGLTVGAPVDVTVPVATSEVTRRRLARETTWWLSVVGRLADGASPEAARAELDAMFQAYMTDVGFPPGHEMRENFSRIELVPAARGLGLVRRQFSRPLTIVMAIVGLVLAIGCANVASLLFARASERRSEMSLRLAIGASRGRLIRQLLTEGAVFTVLATAAGFAMAYWSVDLLVAMIAGARQGVEASEQILLDAPFDLRVLGFTAIVAVLVALVCSLGPAWRATAARWTNHGGSMPRGQRRVGQALVVLQVALSLILLSGAALFLRTLQRLETVETGFRRDGVMAMYVDATPLQQPSRPVAQPDRSRTAGMWDRVAAALEALPGVRSGTVADMTPLSGADQSVNVSVVGGPVLGAEDRLVHLNHVTAGFFETFGIRLRAGRPFSRSDTAEGRQVAILNEAAGRRYFGRASPLGRIITFNSSTREYEIVGVAADVRYASLRAGADRMVYLPMSQALFSSRDGIVAVQAAAKPGRLFPALQNEIRRAMPGAFVGSAVTLEQQMEGSLVQERLVTALASAFGVLALVLACIGLYGTSSYAVARRAREFGVRIAVGARRRDVTRLVLRETIGLVAAAVGIGLLAVLFLGRYVRSMLFEIAPTDSLALAAAVTFLVAVAAVAAYVPARRAGEIDVVSALRNE